MWKYSKSEQNVKGQDELSKLKKWCSQTVWAIVSKGKKRMTKQRNNIHVESKVDEKKEKVKSIDWKVKYK